MNRSLFLSTYILFVLALCGCSRKEENGFNIIGVWELSKITYPSGSEFYVKETGYSRCKIYDADSTYYTVELKTQGNGTFVIPHEMAKFTQHDTLYIENGRVTPFAIINDTTMTTVWADYLETWIKVKTMTAERKQEIMDIVKEHSKDGEVIKDFIYCNSDNDLSSENKQYQYIIIALVLVCVAIIGYLWVTLRGKRKAQKELQAIIDENASHTTEISEKLQQAENDFFGSDYYTSLKKRVMKGDTLKKADWDEMSAQLKEAFPKFESRLSSLCKMSDVEMQVCMLLKLRFSPSEIATVIVKDASTISSIRGRLYQKVFGKKGGAKDWDEFLKGL